MTDKGFMSAVEAARQRELLQEKEDRLEQVEMYARHAHDGSLFNAAMEDILCRFYHPMVVDIVLDEHGYRKGITGMMEAADRVAKDYVNDGFGNRYDSRMQDESFASFFEWGVRKTVRILSAEGADAGKVSSINEAPVMKGIRYAGKMNVLERMVMEYRLEKKMDCAQIAALHEFDCPAEWVEMIVEAAEERLGYSDELEAK